MSVSSTMISTSKAEMSPTVMITVGREALGADDGLALLPLEAGHDAVHGRDHHRLAHVVAGAGQHGFLLADAALLRVHRRRLHLEVGVRLLELLVGDELVRAHLLRPLEAEPRVLDVRFARA